MIDKYIIYLLSKHRRAIVPGFGFFIHSSFEDHMIYFNNLVNYDNRELVACLMKFEGLDKNSALNKIDEFIKKASNILDNNEKFHIVGLGELYKNKDGLLKFVHDDLDSSEKDFENKFRIIASKIEAEYKKTHPEAIFEVETIKQIIIDKIVIEDKKEEISLAVEKKLSEKKEIESKEVLSKKEEDLKNIINEKSQEIVLDKTQNIKEPLEEIIKEETKLSKIEENKTAEKKVEENITTVKESILDNNNSIKKEFVYPVKSEKRRKKSPILIIIILIVATIAVLMYVFKHGNNSKEVTIKKDSVKSKVDENIIANKNINTTENNAEENLTSNIKEELKENEKPSVTTEVEKDNIKENNIKITSKQFNKSSLTNTYDSKKYYLVVNECKSISEADRAVAALKSEGYINSGRTDIISNFYYVYIDIHENNGEALSKELKCLLSKGKNISLLYY